jgi:drug/metabolite transporter (DMT)-like permease
MPIIGRILYCLVGNICQSGSCASVNFGFLPLLFLFCRTASYLVYQGVKVPSTKTLSWIGLGGLLFVLDMSFWNISILKTSASVSTLLANNASVFVGLGAMFFFKQSLSRRYWFGLGVSLLGIFIVAGKDLAQNQSVGIGHLMAITAAVFYAGYMLVTQKSEEA